MIHSLQETVRILLDARVASDIFPGIGRYAFGLVRHLPEAFPGLDFIAARNPRVPDRRFDWRDVEGIPNLRVVECAGDGRGLLDPGRIAAIARRERVDRVHAPYFTAGLASPVPAIVTLHDFIPFEGLRLRLRSAAARWGLTRAAERAACVVTPTEAVRQETLRRLGLAAERVVAIPPGLRVPGPGVPSAVPEGRRYILHVGAQRPHKNLHGLIEAHARAFGPGGPDLVLAGPPTGLTPLLRRRSVEIGTGSRVHFAGEVGEAELDGLYRAAAAFAFVSFSEGFGVPMLEALSLRLPVVASDRPVFHEVCGESAIYVDPEDVDSIAVGLRAALEAGAAADARAADGVRRAAALSWPVLARRYAICYGVRDSA